MIKEITNPKIIMNDPIQLLIDDLNSILESVNSEDDWYKIKKEFFSLSVFPERENSELEAILNKPPIIIEGNLWEFAPYHLKVPPIFMALATDMRHAAFEKLNKDTPLENETGGRICFYCEMYTRTPTVMNCPICGFRTRFFPLNE